MKIIMLNSMMARDQLQIYPISHKTSALKMSRGEKKLKGIKKISPKMPKKKEKGIVTNYKTEKNTNTNPIIELNNPFK